nr:hypothetical protein [Brevibacillus laterosporus]
MIIHGKKDQSVPVENSYDLERSLLSCTKRLDVFEKEAHLFSEEISPTVVDCFNNTL